MKSLVKSIMRITLLVMFCALAFKVNAQSPDWSVDAAQFSNSMNVIGFIKVSGVESTDVNDKVGAFIDGELRGVASPSYVQEVDRYVVFMTVFSNGATGQVSFKVYDASADETFDATATVAFEPGGFVGGLDESFTWSDIDLKTEALMQSFRISSQLGDAQINGFDISINATIRTANELASQTASWTVSEGASVKFNDITQQSGQSQYDFTSPLVFQVQSEDLLTVNDYTVKVTVVNNAPENIQISNASIEENASANLFIGELSTTDSDASDTHSYSLVAGTGSDDNSLFKISGNALISNARFDYEASNTRTIRISSTDSYGESFEKSFTIQIEDLNEAPTGVSFSNSTVNENEENVIVAALTGIDQDAGNTFTYALVNGSGLNDNTLFSLQGNVLKLLEKVSFEEENSLDVRIQVTDDSGLSFTESYVISVNDLNDAPVTNGSIQDLVVVVNSTATVQHAADLIKDEDANDQVTYSLTLANGSALPDWITYNATERSITVLPTIQNAGETNLKLVGTDTSGESAEIAFKITVSVIASIENDSFSDLIEVYPNPARDFIKVDLSALMLKEGAIKLFSPNLGEMVFQKSGRMDQVVEINTSSFSSGVYLLEVSSERKTTVKKVMILK